jgi:hypothetical protein
MKRKNTSLLKYFLASVFLSAAMLHAGKRTDATTMVNAPTMQAGTTERDRFIIAAFPYV